MTENRPRPRQFFLGNIAYNATPDDIRVELEALGISVADVRIGVDQDTGRSRGFAFLDVAPDEPLSNDVILSTLNEAVICGRSCRADLARVATNNTAPSPKRGPARGPRTNSDRRPRGGGRKSDFDRPWRDD